MLEPLAPVFMIEQVKRAGTFSMDTDHFHESYELYYLLAGERNYYINNRMYALRKGDLIFINRNELHRTTAKGTARHERILINFPQEFLQRVLDSQGLAFPFFSEQCLLLRPGAHEQGRLENLLFAMLEENEERRSHRHAFLQTLLVQLLIEMNRIHESSPEAIAPVNDEKQRKAYEIICYLQEHYAGKLTLDELSETFYISSTYLCRLFKQTTGFTIIEYLNTIRVQEAQRRLRDSNAKVSQIAEDTGFDSLAHFGRVFKSIVKRSPLQYRKQNR
ncbi:AraC family transcriptional regulator [Paenibacillus sp. PK3_47]|uniref:helix-turn-helix transcriptional regulator n=1 Tax=Paenibacillus sp. PK3_47 TaxID=2072642 RepID=UPI00201D902C|nr:AraC family transcriptional regulator [Paenibacillus sp. PK3_47]UQZ35623.1 AraC family transcriptional regulator [Paenibacillus sp. PK3_47]